MAFMGCTTILQLSSTHTPGNSKFPKFNTHGIPKMAPDIILNAPENISVDVKSIVLAAVIAVRSGSSVPRSPREPAISPIGLLRNVRQLYAVDERKDGKPFINGKGALLDDIALLLEPLITFGRTIRRCEMGT